MICLMYTDTQRPKSDKSPYRLPQPKRRKKYRNMAKAKSTKASKSTALETKADEVALMSFDYGDDAGEGYDPESAGDIQIPFVTALQALSPQVKKVDKGGIEGAEIGMLYNNVTNGLSDSIRFVPAISKKLYVEWRTRKEGGGYVAAHDLGSDIVQGFKAKGERGPWATDGGKNEIIETQYLYCLVVDEENDPTGEFFVLSFTSTKLSSWRKWNTSIHTFRIPGPGGRKVQPPLYAHVVELKTKEQSNKHGDFYNFVLSPADGEMKKSLVGPQSAAFQAAKDYRAMVESGVAKAASEQKEAPASRHEDDDGDDAF